MRRLSAAFAALLLVSTAVGAKAEAPAQRPQSLDNEVFYQIFTRSMRDSNGDGQGDLKGIEQSLDYIHALGATSILLTPLYSSIFYHNYFADDFDRIDAEYGSMEDFRSLVAAIHARGMKLYLDEEFQYVAYDNPWFGSAFEHPDSPYSDFLIFHGPGNTRPEPAVFGISRLDGFPGVSDGITTVNLNSPKVRAWASDYMMRWADPNGDGDFSDGVDGFRLDHMMDDLDNKGILTDLFATFWNPIFDRLRAANPKLHFIAEQWDWGDGADFLKRGGVDAAFAFPIAGAIRSFDKAKVEAAIRQVAAAVPPGKHELLFVENHDMPRIASNDAVGPDKLRTAATLDIALKGTPLIYYGQELGMRGKARDHYKTDEKDIGYREAFKWSAKDEAPGQANWYKGSTDVWTERFARDDDGVSVAEQSADPDSLLNHYRKLLALRAGHEALRGGDQTLLKGIGGLLAVERSGGGERLLVIANLSERPADYPVSGTDLLSGEKVAGKVSLRPFQATIVKR